MTLDNLNGRVTVAPTSGSQNGIYNLEATWTSVDLNISDPTYLALTVTVTCTIASFTRPTPSSSPIAITLYEKTLNYDFSQYSYVQVPACEYAYTSTYVFTGL